LLPCIAHSLLPLLFWAAPVSGPLALSSSRRQPAALSFRALARRPFLPLRLVPTVALIMVLPSYAMLLGSRLSGLLAVFPINAAILTYLAHRSAGSHAAGATLHGLIVGLFPCAAFLSRSECVTASYRDRRCVRHRRRLRNPHPRRHHPRQHRQGSPAVSNAQRDEVRGGSEARLGTATLELSVADLLRCRFAISAVSEVAEVAHA